MSRWPPWFLVLAVWAVIYLPALGSLEIKGEEGRRILPAMAMLQSGNYLVPQVGSDVYFTKPPLVNWLVAASIKLSGVRSEWTVRLPSALAILLVALVFISVGRQGLGTAGAVIGALTWLTTIGIIEKGRLIEIEAIYVSLCAVAIICWLSWWRAKRSPWLTWTVPWIWLGLGWLAKGPVHLIFFYAVVLAVLWQARQLKTLFHPAHFVGIIIMLAIFAAWAIPFLQTSGQGRGLTKWSAQFTGRSNPQLFNLRTSFSTLIRAIGQFLPWLIFVPLLRFKRFENEDDRRLAKALAWSVAVPLVAVSILPVSAPRYSLPVAAPLCWLMALTFSADAFAGLKWERWRQSTGRSVGWPIVAIVALGALTTFLVQAYRPNQHDKVKSVARQVNAEVPAGETLYAVDPGYQPFLFYVQAPVKYVGGLNEVPGSAHCFFVRGKREEEVTRNEQWARRIKAVSRISDYRNEAITLFRVD